MKSKLIVALAAGSLLALAGTAAAFHDGGVADCQGCHTMHNSLGGTAMHNVEDIGSGNEYLLLGSDASSTCLNCHAASASGQRSYKSMSLGMEVGGQNNGLVPGGYSPGGDFGWLKKDFWWSAHGTEHDEKGEQHGHSIVAADYDLAADSRFAGGAAPFGTFQANDLGCNSCHDPHGRGRYTSTGAYQTNSPVAGDTGNDVGGIDPIIRSGSTGAVPGANEAVGVYRLLGAGDYVQQSAAVQPLYPTEPPKAVSPSSYNKTGATTSMDAWKVRVSYREGMTEWCRSCHENIGNGGTHHVVDGLLETNTDEWPAVTYRNIYNQYKGSGDLSNTITTSYLSLVPFEDTDPSNSMATDDYTAAGMGQGPSTNAQIMCLSCHRAHASGHQSMTRFSVQETMFIEGGVYNPMGYSGDGRTHDEWKASFYNLDEGQMATYQRSLCNKCHAKD